MGFKGRIDNFYNRCRENGLGESCRTLLVRLRHSCWDQRSPWYLKARFYTHMFRLVLGPDSPGKRILGIWDLKALPWSIGDPLVFIETLSVLKLKHNADGVDICVVYDHDRPWGNRGALFDTNLTEENAQDYILDFLPLFGTCPYPGSIFQFNSRDEFLRFIKREADRYHFFPPLKEHLAETYNLYGGSDVHDISEFYRRHGYIPYLRVGERETANAFHFYLENLPEGSIPVTLSLKGTVHSGERNADPNAWLPFIDSCRSGVPEVIFVVVGLREEAFDGLRERANVVIAKDFGTSVLEDLALIRTSPLYMGTASGINCIGWFSDTPYLIFQIPTRSLQKIALKNKTQFEFANSNQKMFDTSIPVTPRLLFDEFEKIYGTIDLKKWQREMVQRARKKYGHPSARIDPR